jgi:hypothetical protein
MATTAKKTVAKKSATAQKKQQRLRKLKRVILYDLIYIKN